LEQRWRDALELVSAAEAPLLVHGRMTFKEHTLVVSGGREHHVARVIIDQTPSV